MAFMRFDEIVSWNAYAALNNLLFAYEQPMTPEPPDSWAIHLPDVDNKIVNHVVELIRQQFNGEIVAEYTPVPPPDWPKGPYPKKPRYDFSYWNLMR